MGNRAVITFDQNPTGNSVGVYLHWNGGAESVYGFVKALDKYKVRDSSDASYQLARFIQIVGNFFGGTTSVGVDLLKNLDCDNGDNGLFVVTREGEKREIKQCKGTSFNGPFTALNMEALAAHGYNVPDKDGESMETRIDKNNKAPFSKG